MKPCFFNIISLSLPAKTCNSTKNVISLHPTPEYSFSILQNNPAYCRVQCTNPGGQGLLKLSEYWGPGWGARGIYGRWGGEGGGEVWGGVGWGWRNIRTDIGETHSAH